MEDTSSTSHDDVVGKYKRLLSMARSSLESHRNLIVEKDNQINQLKSALEEANQRSSRRSGGNTLQDTDDIDCYPRHLSRRVDVEGHIWILVEYSGGKNDEWIEFTSEEELDDYIQRIPGAPLKKPQRCLTVEESAQIETESRKNVERIVEEFRRYKVKTEIARKQRDKELEARAAHLSLPTVGGTRVGAGDGSMQSIMTAGSVGFLGGASDPSGSNGDFQDSPGAVRKLQGALSTAEEESRRWRSAYEQLARENEQLRSRGGESEAASQWRERFESCLIEKEALEDRLRALGGSRGGTISGSVSEGSLCRGDGLSTGGDLGKGHNPSLERAYAQLQAEYKEFKRRVLVLEQERERRREKRRGDASSPSPSSAQPGGGIEAAKYQYIRNLIHQYLSCKDAVVKDHMENAIVTMFRFTENEKKSIIARKKEENPEEAMLSSLTSFVNTFNIQS